MASLPFPFYGAPSTYPYAATFPAPPFPFYSNSPVFPYPPPASAYPPASRFFPNWPTWPPPSPDPAPSTTTPTFCPFPSPMFSAPTTTPALPESTAPPVSALPRRPDQAPCAPLPNESSSLTPLSNVVPTAPTVRELHTHEVTPSSPLRFSNMGAAASSSGISLSFPLVESFAAPTPVCVSAPEMSASIVPSASAYVAPLVFVEMPTPSSWHGTQATTPNYCCGHQTPIQSSCMQDGDTKPSWNYQAFTPPRNDQLAEKQTRSVTEAQSIPRIFAFYSGGTLMSEWEGFQSISRILHFTVLPVEMSPRSRIKIQLSIPRIFAGDMATALSCLSGSDPT